MGEVREPTFTRLRKSAPLSIPLPLTAGPATPARVTSTYIATKSVALSVALFLDAVASQSGGRDAFPFANYGSMAD